MRVVGESRRDGDGNGNGDGLATSSPLSQMDRHLAFTAEEAGHSWSFVSVAAYGIYERGTFMQALREWGFTGPDERRPLWLERA